MLDLISQRREGTEPRPGKQAREAGLDREVRKFPLRRAALIAASAVLLAACQPYAYKGTEYVDPLPAPDFELTRADGGQIRLADLRGRTVVLFFGFTSCPDVCPTTLSDARRILEGLADQTDLVTYLFVTVDPGRDTPLVLERYVAAFDASIIGLTGTPATLAEVWDAYGIYVEEVPLDGGDYSVTHTARVFVIDSEGRLRLTYSFGTPYEDILQDLQHLISA